MPFKIYDGHDGWDGFNKIEKESVRIRYIRPIRS